MRLVAPPARRPLRIASELTTLLEPAARMDVSDGDFLDDILASALRAQQERHRSMGGTSARLPLRRSREAFDWAFRLRSSHAPGHYDRWPFSRGPVRCAHA